MGKHLKIKLLIIPMKKILILISFLALASAGVISLQTNCSFSNSTIFFTIKNIGNDTAYGLSLIPMFEGKNYPAVGKESLPPDEFIRFGVPVQIPMNGTYLSTLSIGYTDSSGVPAFTLAHCIFSYGLPSPTILLLSRPIITQIGSNKYKIDMNITNLGRSPVNSTLFLLLPFSFFSNISNFSFSILPAQTKQFSAIIAYKGAVQGTFEGIAFVPFYLDGKHLTSFVSFQISTYPKQIDNNLLLLAVGVTVVLIIILILLIIKRKK